MYGCGGVQMYRCVGVQMYIRVWCMYRCMGVVVYMYVHGCDGIRLSL